MPHTIEPAAGGRAKCRGCKQAIAKGELRFGERLPNPFADGEMTIWFHLDCAALRRPESFMEIVDTDAATIPAAERSRLVDMAEAGRRHHRLARIAGAERAPSARARCRACRQVIARDDWRIVLEIFEEGMFNPAGYLHPGCASAYFGTSGILERIVRFSPLDPADMADMEALIE